jgi:hypothetical protein
MIITVVAVGIVKVILDQIIDMPAVGHCLVAAPGTVDVIGLVPSTTMVRRAPIRVPVTDFQRVLFHNIRTSADHRMVKVPIMQIIDMAAMFDTDMATVRTVLMPVIGMAFAHKALSNSL